MGKYVERAVKVFLDTGTRFPRRIIWAMGMVKYAAAKANMELGLIDEARGRAIMEAALELARGSMDDRIVVDVFQTGSGTGLNMNVNEVIAEEASRISGVDVHPNDHVNMSQSSNDVVPTAIRVAALKEVTESLIPSLKSFIGSLERLSSRTMSVVKPGRTHLRDALPVTMGQEFDAYRDAFSRDLAMVEASASMLAEVPLGGTAVGTGVNAHPDYPRRAVEALAGATGLPLKPASSRFRAMRLVSDLVQVSSAMRVTALDLWRLGNDIRLMYSGPFTGLAEIDIPQEVPGSSMMPGKVNPVTVEAAMQASAQIVGLDASNTMASLLGEFELSMGLPLVGYNAVTQARLLSEALSKMASLVIDRIEARRDRCRETAERSQALVTVIAPMIGYDEAAKLSEMLERGASMRDALKRLGLAQEDIDRLLDLDRLTKPGIPSMEVRRGRSYS